MNSPQVLNSEELIRVSGRSRAAYHQYYRVSPLGHASNRPASLLACPRNDSLGRDASQGHPIACVVPVPFLSHSMPSTLPGYSTGNHPERINQAGCDCILK